MEKCIVDAKSLKIDKFTKGKKVSLIDCIEKYYFSYLFFEPNNLKISIYDKGTKDTNIIFEFVNIDSCSNLNLDFQNIYNMELRFSGTAAKSASLSKKSSEFGMFALMIWDKYDTIQPKLTIVAERLIITGDIEKINIKKLV